MNGMVKVDYVNTRDGSASHKAHSPNTADVMVRNAMRIPPQFRDTQLIDAFMKAIREARFQNGEGENPLLAGMSYEDIKAAGMQEVFQEMSKMIEEERRKDPELDKEMRGIEEEEYMRFMFPGKA